MTWQFAPARPLPFLVSSSFFASIRKLSTTHTVSMAKTLTLNTADLMGPTLQFPEYTEKFPEFTERFPEYVEPIVHPFPEYIDPLDNMANLEPSPRTPVNKLVEDVVRTPGRQPSPQPAHFSVPYKNGNGNGHRVLRSATVGYIAPEFKGKKAQMLQGE
jgi:hypothetical protein